MSQRARISSVVAPVRCLCSASDGARGDPLVVDTGRADVRIAVIGDFGVGSPGEALMAALVHAAQPDLIATVGELGNHDWHAAGAAPYLAHNVPAVELHPRVAGRAAARLELSLAGDQGE
jgi:hypothetical protein